MTTTTIPTTAGLLDSLATAIEAKDAAAVASHYAPEATLTLLDRDHPPADPSVFAGTAEIEAYFADICGRNMDHRVADRVASPDRIAFTQHCRIIDPPQAVVHWRGTFRAKSGQVGDTDILDLIEVRDGRIASLTTFFDTAYAAVLSAGPMS